MVSKYPLFPLKILVLGGVDTGKSYLSWELVKFFLKANIEVILICADLGQSMVGPPGTISYRYFSSLNDLNNLKILSFDNKSRLYIPPTKMEFVGGTSFQNKNCEYLYSLYKILSDIENKYSKGVAILNSCGYIRGEEAEYVKLRMFQIFAPRFVFALEFKNELGNIIKKIKKTGIPTDIYLIKPSSKILYKTSSERKKYKEKIFDIFFKKANFKKIDRNRVIVPPDVRKDMVVGLYDKNYNTIGLGVIKKISKDYIYIRTSSNPYTIYILRRSDIYYEGSF